MIPRLKEIDLVLPDQIDHPVFLGQSPGPDIGPEVLEAFRLAEASEGVAYDGLDQIQAPQGHASVGLHPESQVLAKLFMENGPTG